MNEQNLPPENTTPDNAAQSQLPPEFRRPVFNEYEPSEPEHETAPSHDGLYGLGGWLILFQLRIYLGIIRAIAGMSTQGADIFVLISIGLLIVCLVYFYKKKMVFRIWYIASIGAVAIDYMTYMTMGLTSIVPILIASLLVESLFIVALFRSERVRNTFN